MLYTSEPMARFHTKTILLLTMIALCLSTPFAPIEAGTFYITVQDLKGLSKVTKRDIDLSTQWEVFNSNLNINVVCVISQINIDERVGLQFNYKLADRVIDPNSQPKRYKKVIELQIVDKKGFSFPQLKLGLNYLIAQNLRTGNYNMTDFQQHLMNQSLTQQQMLGSNKQVHNELFLFPNGFSSFNLTHHVMYNYVEQPYDMYTIHYMTGKGEHFEQGWLPGRDFIYFRYLLFPKYQFGWKQCGAVYETHLMEDFYFECDKKGVDGYFYGLMGYEGKNFAGQFSLARNGFVFHVEKIDKGKMYNVLAVPYRLSEKFNFIDNRVQPYSYHQQKSFLIYLFLALGGLSAIVLIVVVLKKKKIIYFDLQEEKVPQVSSSVTHQKKVTPKKIISNDSTKNQEKSSDESMKDGEIVHSEILTTQEEKNQKSDNFTIQ